MRIVAALIFTIFIVVTSGNASAGDLAEVKESGKLRVALSGAYPPFSMVNEQNEVVGFDVAIGKAIAKEMGLEPVIVTTDFDGIIAGLLAHKYDAIIASMSITPQREKAIDFAGPYYRTGRGIFVSKDSDIDAYEDLKGKAVGVTLGDVHDKWARAQTDMNWTVKTYKGLPEMFLELRSGRLDGLVLDSTVGKIAIQKNDKPLRQLDTPNLEGANDEIGIGIRKGNPKFKAAIQEALDTIKENGRYHEIAMKWVGADIR